jgi:hypothetical protein
VITGMSLLANQLYNTELTENIPGEFCEKYIILFRYFQIHRVAKSTIKNTHGIFMKENSAR